MKSDKSQLCATLAQEDGALHESRHFANELASDLKTAATVFSNIRKMRKCGTVKVEKVRQIPVVEAGIQFYDTVEGCVLSHYKDIKDIAIKEYNKLPETIKYGLSTAPKSGEFADRVILWKEILRPVLTDKQYHRAMKAIISWYIHIIKLN